MMKTSDAPFVKKESFRVCVIVEFARRIIVFTTTISLSRLDVCVT
jgi:hypothetical protein